MADAIAQRPLQAADIVDDVRRVLRSASRGKGTRPSFLTAYQVLNRLRDRAQLIAEHGRGGRGHGTHFAAPSVVVNALKRLRRSGEVVVTFLDTADLQMTIGNETVSAGNRVCALYRMRA